MKLKAALFAASSVLISVLTSCTSLQQDIVMTTDSQVQVEDILNLENTLSRLDAKSITDRVSQEELRNLDLAVDEAITELGMNKALLARLYAIKGRCALLAGSKSKAKDCYNLSRQTSQGDSQTIILGSRLGLIENLDDENLISGSNQNGLLTLERALIYYKENSYSQSLARFDEAFLILPPFYAQNYEEVRTRANEMRGIQDTDHNSSIMAYIKSDRLTVGQMLLISQETSSYFKEFTGGKKQSEKVLFKTAESNSLLTASSGTDSQKIEKDTLLTRRICARFLWNLKASADEGFDKERYSKIFREQNIPSPVADVDTDSPDFDAVLGCIETEVINMDDGEQFLPENTVNGRELSAWLKKLK